MEELRWPPMEEDLRRLYCDQKLSAAKIARAYGLHYPNPKSGETLVLYHLKKLGIPRRDKAEHVRKVTDEMVYEWSRRYNAGESLKQIAGSGLDAVTVWNHLRKRRVQLRDKVEAQILRVTKFQRTPFSADELEKWYLIGFVWGDCSVERHGRAVRVRTGTTHPGLASLFSQLFERYGRVRKYAKRARWVEAEWNLEVDLDGTFEFLLTKEMGPPLALPIERAKLFSFLAGFADAEGTIYYHKKKYGSSFEVYLTNTDRVLLGRIQSRLDTAGFHTKLEHIRQGNRRLGYEREGEVWRLVIWRRNDVMRFLEELPLRHWEKVRKARIAIDLFRSKDARTRTRLLADWAKLIESIREERSGFVTQASEQLSMR